MTESDEKVTIRRRSKPNLGGRPRIEDIVALTPEMMEIARLVQSGYVAEEIATKLDCAVERVRRYLENPVLVAYIKRLLGGDRIMEADSMRWNLYSSVMSFLSRVYSGKEEDTTHAQLMFALELHKRLDPFELLKTMENPQVEELKKRLINPGNKALPVSDDDAEKSIFEPMELDGERGTVETKGSTNDVTWTLLDEQEQRSRKDIDE